MSADDHRVLLRDAVRTFVARPGAMARVRALREARPDFERSYWQQLCDLGCVGVLVDAEHGGLGLGMGDMAAILQETGPALLPEPLVAVAIAATRLLGRIGAHPLARRLLPAIVAGEIMPGVAWQAGGVAWPGVALRLAGDRLSGTARFVRPTTADGFLVTAMSDAGPVLAWVVADAAGLASVMETHVDGTSSARLTFGQVHVADDAVAPIAETALRAVVDECTLGVAAELLGIAEITLRTTLDYLRLREQFGRPIGSFQALQHRAVDLYARQELARASLGAAIEACDLADGDVRRSMAASRAKARCADTALAIGREAVQMHGAMGFADECDVGLYLRRALSLAAWLGNAAMHRARIAGLLRAPGDASTADDAASPRAGETETSTPWRELSDEDFRLRVRAIFEREYPPALRNPPRRLRWDECHDFYARLGELGLLALAWPPAFGGAGLSPRQQLVFMQEQDRWGVARAPDMGITMVGPGLIRFGTTEQQQRYLPSILAMQHMWCQGFSEPNAGSDLASLSTEAVRVGEGWRINGSKIWTTFAQDATHMFMLARTNKAAKKQAGISVFLVALDTPGITVRTIADIAGHEEFCEVRFDDVEVAADAVLGPVDGGWTVAKMLLAQERIYLGNPRQAQYALRRLDAIAQACGLADDAVFTARLTELRLDVWDLASLYERFAEQVRRGEPLGPEVSILKLIGSETTQRLSELAVSAVGPYGGLAGEIALGDDAIDVMSLFMNARPTTIYGGSSEVQRNVLAKQVLELPT